MYYVYVIQSERDKRLYIGFSANLRQRIVEHNNGKGSYTKNFRPWKLIYYEAYLSKRDAQIREKKLKQNPNSATQLKKRIVCSRDEDWVV